MQQRWISILAIALGVQVVLAVALGLRGNHLEPGQNDARLVLADLKTVDKLVFDGPHSADAPAPKASDAAASDSTTTTPAPGNRLELVKRDGKWLMPLYHDAPADAAKVQGLLDKLSNVKRGFPVARTADAQQRFKVADANYERRVVLSAGDKSVATAYLGTSPAMRKSHARAAQDDAIYAVELTPQDVDVAPAEWLDTGLLQVSEANLSEIAVAAKGKAPVTLVKATAAPAAAGGAASGVAGAASGAASSAASAPAQAASASASASASTAPPAAWQARSSTGGDLHVDAGRATALVNALVNLRVDAVLGTQAKPQWQQDAPELTLTLKNPQGKAITWVISKQQTGDDYVLKASDQPWFLELKRWAAMPVLDAAAPERLAAGNGVLPMPTPTVNTEAAPAVAAARAASAAPARAASGAARTSGAARK